jgi:pyruvate/2-oxoglutarate/acetoin dehydrogenase E1 component
VDHKRLFPMAGIVPAHDEIVPLGRALVRRPGRHVSIATFSFMTRVVMEAAGMLAGEGIECEVIDLRSLAPLDMDVVCESVRQTGTLVTVEEGQLACGVGAEIAFRLGEQLPGAQVARVGALPAPVSSNPILEAACLPDAARVISAVRRVLNV